MINLDESNRFQYFDPSNMLHHIDTLPDQLEQAWVTGGAQPLEGMRGIERVLVAGMGGSAIGADLLAAYLNDRLPVPITVHRDYDLPGWARGPETLVITSSHSGNTEETLSAFDRAVSNGCRVLAIATGGMLAEKAREAGVPLWIFEHKGQPRAAVGYSFALLLAALVKLGLVENVSGEVKAAVNAMRQQQETIKADVPLAKNPAKRLAGQMMGRIVTVVGSDLMAPVARRWKTQINEISKAVANFEVLPEADHNTLAGVLFPEDLLAKNMVIFLQAASDHRRNNLRSNLTREGFMLQGITTDVYHAKGATALEQLWTAVHFGDYVSYYLAMAYETDPTPVEAIENLKKAMRR